MKIKNGKKVKTNKKIEKIEKIEKDLSSMTPDEFLDQSFESSDDEENDKMSGSESDDNGDNDENNKMSGSESDDSGDEYQTLERHKQDLANLAKKHPDLYKTIKNDEKSLLDFDISDNENMSDDDDELGDDSKFHTPSTNLEVASDESDFEPGDDDEDATETGRIKITLKLLKTWEEELATDKSSKTIKNAVDAFHAALVTISDPDNSKDCLFQVEGSAIFNGVVQLCILHLPVAFKNFLNIHDGRFEAHKSKKFAKIKGVIKCYLVDLIKILHSVTSAEILVVLLKHLHQMLPYAQSYSSLKRPLLRILLKLWSTGEENARVVSFLNIIRIATSRQESILETLFKTMYIKYVENSKFLSPSTMAGINFMRHSLVEIYNLDNNLAYNHAFLYIRQLAIHLRNAMTLKKKEHFQSVYNWQFINSLRFWSDLVMRSKKDTMLHTLLYPLVQIITATIQLVPTSQYYPLRCHCVQILINISKETDTFIPVLPYLLEVLANYDFNKKHTRNSKNPISFICLLKLSKAQLNEKSFKNELVETLYQLILESASKDSSFVYFPDIYIPCVMELKAFLRKSKVATFSNKMKQLLDKIKENRQFIETERNKIIIDLSDMKAISHWEQNIRNQETPITEFYNRWFKVHQKAQLKMLSQNETKDDYKITKSSKRSKSQSKNQNNSDHDSDLDMPVEEMEKLLKKQEERKKNKSKRQKIQRNNDADEEKSPRENNDIVKNASINDWD